MCSNGVEVFAMGVRCDEVGGGGVESGQWVTSNDEGCGARRALDPSVFPVYEPQMGRGEVKFIKLLGVCKMLG